MLNFQAVAMLNIIFHVSDYTSMFLIPLNLSLIELFEQNNSH